MRLACSTASFPQDRLEIATAKIAWAGFEGAELVLDREPLPEAEALSRRLRADELELTGVDAGVISTSDGDAPVDALASLGRAAVLTRLLDGGLLIVRAGEAGSLAGLAQSLRMLDAAVRDVPVDFCLVNRCGTLLASREALAELWQEPLPARVGIALDPAQAFLAGWNPLELDALPRLPRQVDLNDSASGKVVPPGEGGLDLAELGARLRREGFQGPLCLKLENADPWAVEPVSREIREAAADWFGL